MKRRLISTLVSLTMIITMIYPMLIYANAATWNGTRTTPPISGGVYQISTGEQLAWFANAVNNGSSSIKAILTSDIYLNDEGEFSNQWTPIGSETNPFKGTFNGNGFTIHGVYINSGSNYAGFFGNVDVNSPTVSEDEPQTLADINIKNVKIVDSKISGNQNVGGIVGYGHRVGMENCSFDGEVTGTYNSVGGLIGWAYADSRISKCKTSGSVTGLQRTAGIAGFMSGNSVVEKSYSDADVNGTQNIGGIVGTLTASDLNGCFFLGTVTANDKAGGIVGYSAFGNVTGAYAIAEMTSSGTLVGGAIGTIYGGEYNSVFYSYETSGFDGDQGVGRTLEEMGTSNFIRELNLSAVYFAYDYTNINNGHPVLTWMLETDVWLGELEQPVTNSTGTYLISKPSELAWFSALVNGTLNGTAANPAANAMVISDLLFNISVYNDTYGIIEWTPIGTASSPYTGTFNGGGYNIAGIYTTSSSGTNGVNVGLFGYAGTGASILNTVVIDGLIAGVENVGGIVGYAIGATISSCTCRSEIQGDKAVGGIVGNLSGSTSVLTTSCMSGTVNGSNFSNDKSYLQSVGGVVGYNNRGSVTKCFNYADINAPLARYVGGVIGSNVGGSLTNSYNASPVSGSATAGGIVGYNNNGTVTTCYSAGKVTAVSSAGMAFGNTTGAGVSGCYFDTNYNVAGNNVTGATGLESSAMTGSTALTNMGMSTSTWKATAQDRYYYYYPQINSLAYSTVKAIKAASLESVRRVQHKYIARVEIDGRADTYYETFDAALSYASGITGTVLPIIYLVRDYELTSTINITENVGFFGDDGAVLTRSSTLTGPMFDITGSLIVGSNKYGDDNNISLYINGNNVAGTDTAFVVENGGTLNIGEGVKIEQFRNATNLSNPIKGTVIRVDSGTLKISGGFYENNISNSVAGVIYNNGGDITLSGGVYQMNESKQGGVVYNDNGTLVISGGTFSSNIAESNGGVATTTGVYGKTVVTGTALLSSNESTVGGALSVKGYGTLEISGGTITQNHAYSTGGAIQIEPGSETLVTGGTIYSNTLDDGGLGSAVYNGGKLTLNGAAQIDSGNDVYLVNGKTITIEGRLTCAGYAATITPQTYTEGKVVLDGTAMSSSYSKFGISNNAWHTLANGTITSMETTTVAILSKSGAYSVEYISIADAFEAVEAGETAIITVVADSTISKTIPVYGDVTVVCDDDTFSAMRSGSFYGVLFDVQPGSSLKFGESIITPVQQSQLDYAANTDTQGSFILDGGYTENGVVGAAAVNVQSGGSFYMYDGAVIQNFNNTTTGTVVVSGNMMMYGGTIRNNTACYGGAVYVKAAGILNTYGGVIADNVSSNGGDAVYALGRVTRNIHTYDYWYVETIYDEDGNITGYKDAVQVSTSKSDIKIKDTDAIYLGTNVIYMDETQSDTYVTSLSQVPETTEFTVNDMTLDFANYMVGALAVSYADILNYYTYFNTYKEGYYILYNGTLGINKLVPKTTSGLTIDRETDLISGIKLDCATVGEMALLFENDKTLVKFYDADGKRLRNSNAITTGCSIQLNDAGGNIIDTVTLVVYGDVNMDYLIDGQDSVLIRAIAAGMLTSDNILAAQIEASDVNFDDTTTEIDSEHTDMSGVFLQTIGQTK